jgi:hypothetical protein
MLPGVMVSVQVPDAGRSYKKTLPVGKRHVGCVIGPIAGGAGGAGWALITTLADGAEVHPDVLVAVNVYVPGTSPEIVVPVPVPLVVIFPGVIVNVQFPDDGKSYKNTLPAAKMHVGCVTGPTEGVPGFSFTVTTISVLGLSHPFIVWLT